MRGACEYCSDGTVAYVLSSEPVNGSKYSDTWIRFCPNIIQDNEEEEVGLTILHELLHIVSAVIDHWDDTLAYHKLGMVTLAR